MIDNMDESRPVMLCVIEFCLHELRKVSCLGSARHNPTYVLFFLVSSIGEDKMTDRLQGKLGHSCGCAR